MLSISGGCLGGGQEREGRKCQIYFFFVLHIFVIPATHRKNLAVLTAKVPVHLYGVGQAFQGRNRHQAILFGQLYPSCVLTAAGIRAAEPQREV